MALTLAYAAALVPEIADDIAAVDEAMRLGYTWKCGPFELHRPDRRRCLRRRGSAKAKLPVPPLLAEREGAVLLSRRPTASSEFLGVDGAVQRRWSAARACCCSPTSSAQSKPVARNGSASLWDIGDGVPASSSHTKMNALDADIMDLLKKSLETVEDVRSRRWSSTTKASNFSVGANIGLALFAANIALWPMIEELDRPRARTPTRR